MRKKPLIYAVSGVVVVAVAVVCLWPQKRSDLPAPRDYDEIKASGVLNVTTEYNSVSYHVEKDSFSGFHYELARLFADAKGLQLHMVPEMSLEKQTEGVNNGIYDLIANSMLVTSETKDSTLAFTIPLLRNKQVLVQRKEKAPADTSLFVRNQLELAGKKVYIPYRSPASYRIRNLSAEIGGTIEVVEMERYGTEQLLAMVAHGDIDYAVCEASLAQVALPDFPQLDISTEISFNQFYAWGVSKQSPVLLDSLNHWLQQFMQQKEYQRLLQKYGIED